MKEKALTQETLKALLHYDPVTGVFTWLVSPSFTVKAGDKAGNVTPKGYWQIGINRKRYLAHRLAWLYVHGVFPEKDVDHINRNPADNRIVNLRDVSNQFNLFNTSKQKDNTSGYKGVTFMPKVKKWQAQIRMNSKKVYLGTFDTPERADIAHRIAEYFREKYYDHSTTKGV